MTNLLILDTLSIRDFGAAGLLPAISRFSFRVTTTSTAYLQGPFPGAFTHAPLETGKIYLSTLSPDELQYSYQLSTTLPGLTLADYSVLFLTSRDNGTLLTIDPRMLKAAEAMRLTVCTYSGVLEQLAMAGIISHKSLKHHYTPLLGRINKLALPNEKQLFVNSALPKKEKLA
ncbi:MAG TPA: hypothetical protein PLP88_13855 [Bacteroidales bacterium]|nr:hypothetical protein [Bacteroidales bacterium]